MSGSEASKFIEPQRKVLTPKDIESWEKSEAYQDILGFLMAMNESVKGKKLSSDCTQSKGVQSVCDLLHTLNTWVDEIPPIDQPQRYGNKAFRDFHTKLKENCASLLKQCLPEANRGAVVELSPYLTDSFGNSTRIDYGTGHELAFVMFLCSLHKIGFLAREDSVATVNVVFKRYLDLSRKLQTVYKMEPAGSQGVWSLDDYQFVPFIWGSSQLMMHPKISPEMFTNENIVKEYANEYLFLSCIQHILSVKTGPFAEHSNQLWNISAVQSWSKINSGLFKMYKAEILNKFPIIQHVLFGSILSFDPAKSIRFPSPLETGLRKGGVGMMAPSNPRTCMMPPAPGRTPPNLGATTSAPGTTTAPPLGTRPGAAAPGRMPLSASGAAPKSLGPADDQAIRMPTASAFASQIASPVEGSGLREDSKTEND